ncbi:MAG TPA: cupin domain-containing protein [Symbiobacteriaceae bacterium]|nr:cupin domain-containing protein [Symbiobacteriaceae bacterium]
MEPKIISVRQPKPEGSGPLYRDMLYQAAAHDFNLIQAVPGFCKEPHPYPAGDAFMLVLQGSMELTVDGVAYPLAAGQLAIVPKGAVRGFTAGPEGFTMFAAHLKG